MLSNPMRGPGHGSQSSPRRSTAAHGSYSAAVIAAIRRNTVILEILYTAFVLSYFLTYISTFTILSDPDKVPLSLIIVAYVLFAGVVLVFVMRFARPWLQCKGTLSYQHVDLSVLKLITKDPMMLIIVAACVLFMVIDFIIPRTAMSFGNSSMLVVELLTILFSDAQVNESRRFIMFHTVACCIVMTWLTFALAVGLVPDAPLFTIRLRNKENVNTSNTSGGAIQPSAQLGVVSYTRSQVQRMLLIQIGSCLLPALIRRCKHPLRDRLAFGDRPIERWEVLDTRTLPFIYKKHVSAFMAHLQNNIDNAMQKERESGIRPPRLMENSNMVPQGRISDVGAPARRRVGIEEGGKPCNSDAVRGNELLQLVRRSQPQELRENSHVNAEPDLTS